MPEDKQQALRALPKVDEWLRRLAPTIAAPTALLKRVVQDEIERERRAILAAPGQMAPCDEEQWRHRFNAAARRKLQTGFRPVINATGVVIHTNLGRSLLAEDAAVALCEAGKRYSNLEFDLESGQRGSRYSHIEDILRDLTGAEAALVVNNNAAAVFLALETLAKGKEVIVSRGQLVEIGGSFRIPDVMARSGAKLVEVGATNRTHPHDYEGAISPETALLLKVHTSNFRLIGFTSEVAAADLARLAHERNLLAMEDLGSGSLLDLSAYGLPREPTVREVVAAGIDVVCFSGDKLLGGPQAGIIVGTKAVIAAIKKNPLNRALRIDKFTLASLEATLRHYYQDADALANIPTLKMLVEHRATTKKRAERLLKNIRESAMRGYLAELRPTASRVGGGAMPEYNLSSFAVVFSPDPSREPSRELSLNRLERDFRAMPTPVIGRIERDHFLLDMRTVRDDEIALLSEQIRNYFLRERP
ncbi:MAG: L-seryl-tRNA(Sec) selenium transferase [Desulfobulbaceae bacterium]|jgi:L-seryl-tRNA(Ser) seleniumtransferase|nr:L-seryl-tRNA(Sec) selenium transferase [Desulfobulbaceae bacterium]